MRNDNLNYCLTDGTTLTIEGEVETVVTRKPPERKKSRFLLWLGLLGLFLLFGIGAVAGLLIYKYGSQDESVRHERSKRGEYFADSDIINA